MARVETKDILARLDFRSFYLGELPGLRGNGEEMNANCPFHDDQGQHFYANAKTGAFFCHRCDAKGDPFSFYMQRHGVDFPAAVADLAKRVGLGNENGAKAKKPKAKPTPENITTAYHYHDEQAQYVFSTVRFEEAGADKTFRQWRYDFGTESYVQNIEGVRLVPYQLPEVLPAAEVFIAEGEKDVDNLRALGLVATCNPMGAGKWRLEFSEHFRGKAVVILPDNDQVGQDHGQKVAQALYPVAASVKVVNLPGLPEKGDVSDWLAAGGTVEQLRAMAENAAAFFCEQPGPASHSFRFLSLDEMLSEPRPAEWLIRRYLEADTLSVLFGASGSMKSFVALDLGLCIASGRSWHGNAVPNPGPVFYIAGEGFRGLAKRLKAWTNAHGVATKGLPFFTASQPAQFLDHDSAATLTASVADLAAQHGAPRLVVVDTLNRCFGEGDENNTADMTAFVAAVDRLRFRFGCAVLIVHHSGLQEKDRSRGSSVLRGALDFEYRLEVKGNTRTLSCTKSKDHDAPPALSFEPEAIGTGWLDQETGEEIMSCVLLRAEAEATSTAVVLKGAKRTAYEALLAVCERAGGSAHVNTWREEAYSRGISPSPESGARQRAFHRAVMALQEMNLIECENDLYQPNQTNQTNQTKPDNCLDLNQTDKTPPFMGCLVSGPRLVHQGGLLNG